MFKNKYKLYLSVLLSVILLSSCNEKPVKFYDTPNTGGGIQVMERNSKLRTLEGFLKLAYTLSNEQEYGLFKKQATELMTKEVYANRIENFFYPKGVKWGIETLQEGYALRDKVEDYHFKFKVTNKTTTEAYYVDCFVLMEDNKIVDLIGY